MTVYDVWIIKFIVYIIALKVIPKYCMGNIKINIKLSAIVWGISLLSFIITLITLRPLMEVYEFNVYVVLLVILFMLFHLTSVISVVWLIYLGYKNNPGKAKGYSIGFIVLREYGFFSELLYLLGGAALIMAILKKRDEGKRE